MCPEGHGAEAFTVSGMTGWLLAACLTTYCVFLENGVQAKVAPTRKPDVGSRVPVTIPFPPPKKNSINELAQAIGPKCI